MVGGLLVGGINFLFTTPVIYLLFDTVAVREKSLSAP